MSQGSIHGIVDLLCVVCFLLGAFSVGGALTAASYLAWAPGRMSRENGTQLMKLVVPSGAVVGAALAGTAATATGLHPLSLLAIGCCLTCLFIGVLATAYLNEPKVHAYVRAAKGRHGERLVRRAIAKAGMESVHGLYLQRDDGFRATEIDHVVRCPHALLVIETKNWQGTFKARADDVAWSASDGDDKWTVSNPLRQNGSHVRAVQSAFGLPVVGMVAMTDLARFPDGCPEDVIQVADLGDRLSWLKSLGGCAVDDEAWSRVTGASQDVIEQGRLRAWHRAFMNERGRSKPAFQGASCPKCGGTDVCPRPRSKPTYTDYLYCRACHGSTPYRPPYRWRSVVEDGGLVCVEEEGDGVHVVVPKGTPTLGSSAPPDTVDAAADA